MSRKIIHIDMDAFFASVEQRDNPALKGKPIAVGGSAERGVVAAASYEARKFGVRSAMPSVVAKRKCPSLIFVKHRFEVYRSTSLIIRSVFKEYTDLIEPLSLDEAYLDVTQNKKNIPSATIIAEEIRTKIEEKTGITASAGVSFNKFLAKVASDMNKPNGLFTILPEEAALFMEKLPIHKFYGIGKRTEERLRRMGIFKGKDLKKISKKGLEERFGKAGVHYYNIVRAIDNRPVVASRPSKSIGAENTFSKDIYVYREAAEKIETICQRVFRRLKVKNKRPKTLTLKVKYNTFKTISRSITTPNYLGEEDQLVDYALVLLDGINVESGIRLLGVSCSNFWEEDTINQLDIAF